MPGARPKPLKDLFEEKLPERLLTAAAKRVQSHVREVGLSVRRQEPHRSGTKHTRLESCEDALNNIAFDSKRLDGLFKARMFAGVAA